MSFQIAGGSLFPTPPFDFAKSLAFIGMFPPTKGEQHLAQQELTKAVYVAGQTVVFRVASKGSITEPELAYTLFANMEADAGLAAATVDRLSFFLSLFDELDVFYRAGLQDSSFAPIIKQLYGYHQVKFLTPFENMCWAILTQRTPIPVASRMKQSLTDYFGNVLEVDTVVYKAFPGPGQLTALAPKQLESLIGNKRKADYLHAAAQVFGTVDEE